MANTIQIRRGLNASVPVLADGEFGLSTDTLQLYVGNSSSNVEIATKSYVDAVAQGLDVKASVEYATVDVLPACTASGSKAGKTLTMDSAAVLSIDNVATVLNDRILVKNQAEPHDNGIYKVTTEGTVGVAAVLTRATDADTNAKVTAGMFTFVTKGDTLADKGFVLTTNDPIDLDTDPLAFSQFSGGGNGDMLLAGTQEVTGAKTFDVATFILKGSTSGTTEVNSNATAGTTVLTMPAGTQTLLGTLSTIDGGAY